MKKKLAAFATSLLCVTATACTSGIGQGQSPSVASTSAAEDKTPVTITVSSFFTDKEKGIVDTAFANFHKKYPWITVKHTGGQTKDVQLQSLRGSAAPDILIYGDSPSVPSLCKSGEMLSLNPYMARDGLKSSDFVQATKNYTSWGDNTCAFPMLSDVYALFYDKDALSTAGITPPKTWSEMASAAEKLTIKNSNGSLKRAGFLPLLDYGEMNVGTVTPGFNLSWYDDKGKATMSTDDHWATMLRWQKQLIQFYGTDQLTAFRTKLGDEFSTANPLYTGQLPMMIDGEWRTAFIKREKPSLNYGVVPIPNDDPSKYGGGYIAGTTIGIAKSSKHQEAAWKLTRFMATDPSAVHDLAVGLGNVPTNIASLNDADLRKDPNFATLMDIAQNPNSLALPATLSGSAAADLFTQKVGAWQQSPDTDPKNFLQQVTKQINASLSQNGS